MLSSARVMKLVSAARGVADVDFHPRIGAAHAARWRRGIRQGDEAGFSGPVEFADPGVGGEAGKGCAEGRVKFGAADEDQAEVRERVRPEDQAQLRGGRVKVGDLPVAKRLALAVGAQVGEEVDFGAKVEALDGTVKRKGMDQAAEGGDARARADAKRGVDGEAGDP